MEIRKEIVNGKKRIIITKEASGVDKVKDAILVVMGPGWAFEEKECKTT